jgi:hypothetical protein
VNINLHLTDDTQLRAHGFVAGGGVFAEVQWDFRGPFPDWRGDGKLWGTPTMLRQLAAVAVLARGVQKLDHSRRAAGSRMGVARYRGASATPLSRSPWCCPSSPI